MSLIVADLKKSMLAATKGIGKADDALTALGDSINDYVISNLEINYVWAALGPPPASIPDPVIAASGSLIGFPVNFLPVKSAGGAPPPAGVLIMQTALIAALTASAYSIDDTSISVWTVIPGSMVTSPSLAFLNLSAIKGSTTRDEAYQAMADSIITWLKLQVPAGPVAGTRITVPPTLIYTGTGTVIVFS